MREIKFRGKRLDNGEWAYGYYSKKKIGNYDMTTYRETMSDFIITNFSDGGIAHAEVSLKTVGEYIGRNDKEGKEIYKGHILYNQRENSVYEVVWIDEECRFALRYKFKRRYEGEEWVETNDNAPLNRIPYCVIIGNIHDNPELLEVEK